jgi:hypothetical protein
MHLLPSATRKSKRNMPKFKINQVVRVIRAPEGQNTWILTGAEYRAPRAGDRGAVVEVYSNPHEAHCIQAVAPDGRTNWLLDFLPEELESVSSECEVQRK